MLVNCVVGEDSQESIRLQGDATSQCKRTSVLNIHWKDWFWGWNSSTLATSCKELTHWKRLWCWKRLKAGGEGDDRGWDGWMASLTQWTWVWVNSGSWKWTGRPGVLPSMRSQRVRQTERLHFTSTQVEKGSWTCDQISMDLSIVICKMGNSLRGLKQPF